MHNTTRLSLRIFRFLRLLLHIISGFIQSLIYPYLSRSIQKRMKQYWAFKFLDILNIKLHCNGKPPSFEIKRVLFVANHISWLDICVLLAACPTRFIAKAEIRHWPVVGLLSRKVGTLFIERTKRSDTIRINRCINDVLSVGDRVTIFPEGTTSDGTVLQHFHASLLQSAATAGVQLCPIAIRYRNSEGKICKEAAYIDPSLLLSLKQILKQTRIDVDVIFLEPIASHGKNRRELARFSEQAIASALSISVAHREPGKFLGRPIE
ncbi:MAG: 1-acyl-sn-glycerol-3-phosphate acyltransferase [Nitrosomonas sp.]|jgi:1-acyl-sn-glycerol-3-phosphate acyltransferase|nr:1-acyl-sn-glycerol-3-phosphate acyltransferase [Nitrosomonas sp.]